MAGSLLGYRVHRLRRLIVVCLGLLAAGVAAGIWLLPGASALQIVFGIGLFSMLAMAHLAIILFWPQDTVEPLMSALGFAVALPIALPAIASLTATPAETIVAFGIALIFLPIVWGFGIKLIGWAILKPLDMIRRKDVVVRSVATLPMDMAAARTCFFIAPHRKRLDSITGPLEWDGFITETNTRREVGPSGTEIVAKTFTNRHRILDETETTQGVLVQIPGADGAVLATIVLHQTLAQSGTTTRLDRRFNVEKATVAELFIGWLGDMQQDSITALVDDALGQPTRAISAEPRDTLPNAISRWFRWNEPAPGDH
jgi:hypothetical protein